MSLLLALTLALVGSTQQSTPHAETYDEAMARGLAGLRDRPDESIAAFQKCLGLRPKDPQCAYNIAASYSHKGDATRALEWLGNYITWGNNRELFEVNKASGDPDFQQVRLPLLARARQLSEAAARLIPSTYIDWAGRHRLGVNSAKISPDGSKIVTACADGWARIWDIASGELLVLLIGHQDEVVFCSWADSDRTVITGGSDNTLRFWDARTGDPLRVFPGTPFSKPGCMSSDGGLIASPLGSLVRLFDLESERGLELDLESNVYGVSFSPDGRRFALGNADGSIHLFDTWSRESVATCRTPSPVFDLSFSPSGSWLATGGADGVVRWLDARTLQLVRSYRAHRAEVNSVAFSPDGNRLLTTGADRMARLWNTDDDSPRFTLAGHTDEITWGSFSSDGSLIATPSADSTVRLWNTSDGTLLQAFGGSAVLYDRTLAFAAEETLISFEGGIAREWDIAAGRELSTRHDYPSVHFKKARGGTACERLVRDIGWRGRPQVIQLEGAGADADAVALSPKGRFVYSVDADEHGRLWSVETGQLVRDLGRLSRDGELTRWGNRWTSACFSPDETMLATARQADGAAHLFDSETGEEIVAFRGGGSWAAAVAFDATGEFLAVTRSDDSCDIWNTISGERAHTFATAGWRQVVFSPDGRFLAAVPRGGPVRVLDLTTGECLRTLEPLFPAKASGVAFTPGGKVIAAAMMDQRILLWNIESGKLLGTIVPGEGAGDWLAFAQCGHYHGTPASIARARLVQGAISYPLSCFAAALEDPEKVRAALSGVEVELPKLSTPPSLVVAEPAERLTTVREPSLRLQAIATEGLAGVERIDVVQDGASVPGDTLARALRLENNERLARLDLRLSMPAGATETRITLQAVSARGIKSRPESFVVRYEPPKRELYVLTLGVADYADDKLDLACPVQDVDGLVERFQGQEELFHAVHVERRVDREVTSAEVLRLRDEFLLQAKPDDTLVVFVAGHGVRTDTGEYWFLTSDATPARPYSGIKRADLESLVTWDKLHATKRVLLLDTCHSGADFGKGTRGERGIAFQQSEVDNLLERSSGLYILAATSDDGFAREQAGNGLFTKALLDGLDGAADAGDFGDKDGTVGIDELMHFARYAVLERSEGRQKPTFPKVEGGENFPLARVPASGEVR